MIAALASALLLCVPPAAGQAPAGTPAPAKPAPAPAPAPPADTAPPMPPMRPTHGEGSNPDGEARAAARAAAESDLLITLVPPPLTAEELRAVSKQLGAGAGSENAVDASVQRYESLTATKYDAARLSVRARLAAGFRTATATGMLQPMAGPELAALLSESADWRATLAAADSDFLKRAALQRSADAAICPGLALYSRVVERDDAPASDPAAALRITDLIDRAEVSATDRLRVENALDRQWTRLAIAIAARRVELSNIAIERARLEEQWGPAWEITASQATIDDRMRMLDRLAARERATEGPLRDATREAAATLLKVLAPDAAERVHDVADRTVWPWLFESELALEGAVARAGAIGGPPLGEPLAAMLHEMKVRLGGTRRELGKRAAKAEELETIIANAQTGTPAPDPLPLLEAQRKLQEILDRRRRTIRDAAVRMQQAAAGDPLTRAIFDERVAAIEAETRSAQWRLRGIDERIAELRGGTEAGDEPAPEGATKP
jgi:hypothetical protein